MKDTNRRIDLEVEELTRRICFESKPLWERVWIKFKKWMRRGNMLFDVVILYCVFLGIVCVFLYLANYLITIL